jgi:hypothetical protein
LGFSNLIKCLIDYILSLLPNHLKFQETSFFHYLPKDFEPPPLGGMTPLGPMFPLGFFLKVLSIVVWSPGSFSLSDASSLFLCLGFLLGFLIVTRTFVSMPKSSLDCSYDSSSCMTWIPDLELIPIAMIGSFPGMTTTRVFLPL